MTLMVKNHLKLDYEDKIFQAKIRGCEMKEEIKVTPMKKEDWTLVFKEIKKKQLAFERNKKAVELNRRRAG